MLRLPGRDAFRSRALSPPSLSLSLLWYPPSFVSLQSTCSSLQRHFATCADPSHWKIIPQRERHHPGGVSPLAKSRGTDCTTPANRMSDNTTTHADVTTDNLEISVRVAQAKALARKSARQRALQRLTGIKIIGASASSSCYRSHLHDRYIESEREGEGKRGNVTFRAAKYAKPKARLSAARCALYLRGVRVLSL